MNFSFIIRKAEKKDASSIQKILNEAFLKYKIDSKIPGKIDAINESLCGIENAILENEVFIALIDEIPVGTVRIKITDSKTAYLSRFAVCSNFRNIGIGKSLMNLVDKYVLSNKIEKVYLYTASKHYDLVKFYYNRGFHIDCTTKDKGYTRAFMIKEYNIDQH